jgi:hypothetical protein
VSTSFGALRRLQLLQGLPWQLCCLTKLHVFLASKALLSAGLRVCRYTQQLKLRNTGAIPLEFRWHMADETTYTARDFTVLPAAGAVLPQAKQVIQVEFLPQSVQHYNLSLVMDIPGVTNAAAAVTLQGECAVPIIRLAEGNELLQFGDVFVHYPYSQQFTLLNDSKLPAKFQVLPQVCDRGPGSMQRKAVLFLDFLGPWQPYGSNCQA